MINNISIGNRETINSSIVDQTIDFEKCNNLDHLSKLTDLKNNAEICTKHKISLSKPLNTYIVEEVNLWLTGLSLREYVPIFAGRNIDGPMLNNLNHEKMSTDFNTRNKLHHKRLAKALRSFKTDKNGNSNLGNNQQDTKNAHLANKSGGNDNIRAIHRRSMSDFGPTVSNCVQNVSEPYFQQHPNSLELPSSHNRHSCHNNRLPRSNAHLLVSNTHRQLNHLNPLYNPYLPTRRSPRKLCGDSTDIYKKQSCGNSPTRSKSSRITTTINEKAKRKS